MFLALCTSGHAWAFSPEEVVGTWKMLSTVFQPTGSDKAVDNLGSHPKGILIITPDYRFMIIETGSDRKPAKTTEEFAALQRSELAYAGLVTFATDPENPRGNECHGCGCC